MGTTMSLLDHPMAMSRFAFQIIGIPDDAFDVASMTIENHALSGHYRIRLDVHSEAMIDGRLMAHRPAIFSWKGAGSRQWFHGRVIQSRRIESSGDRIGYQLWMESPLSGLARRRSHRVFRDRSVPEMAADILSVPEPKPIHTEWQLHGKYPERPYTVQWAESDLAFLTRQLSGAGIFFLWRQTATESTLIFSDDASTLAIGSTLELHHTAPAGTHRLQDSLHQWRPSARLTPEAIRVIAYNDQTPETPIIGKTNSDSASPHFGCQTQVAAGAQTTDTATAVARNRMAVTDSRCQVVLAESDCMAAAPGRTCAVTGNPDSGLNGNYLITRVSHSGDQRSGPAPGAPPKGPTYQNRLTLIPAATPFQPIPASPVPTMPEAMSTAIDTGGGPDAHLDDQGRYRLRLHFDRVDRKPASASEPIRLMQPYAGDGFGSHIPLHSDTEAVVIHTHDHPDRPHLLGTVTNPNTPTPVTSANRANHRLRTAGRNSLSLDDGPRRCNIQLDTSGHANRLWLTASDSGDRIELATDAGDMALEAGGEIRNQSGASQSTTIGGSQVVRAKGRHHLTTRSGDSASHAATAADCRSARHCQWAAKDSRHHLVAAQHIHAHTNGTWSARAVTCPLVCASDQQSVSVTGTHDMAVVGTGGGPLRIAQAGGGLEVSPDGTLTCGGPSVTISAATINIYTSGVGNN